MTEPRLFENVFADGSKDTIKDRYLKTYTNPSQFGSTTGASISELYAALPSLSMGVFNTSDLTGVPFPQEGFNGVLVIVKYSTSRAYIVLYGKTTTNIGDFRMFLTDSNVPTGNWYQYSMTAVNTTSVQTQEVKSEKGEE